MLATIIYILTFLGSILPTIDLIRTIYNKIAIFLGKKEKPNKTLANNSTTFQVNIDNSKNKISYFLINQPYSKKSYALTEIESENYNFLNNGIHYTLTGITAILFIVLFGKNPLINHTPMPTILIFSQTLLELYSLSFIPFFLFSILIILKSLLKQNLLYRKINMFTYTISLLANCYLFNILSKFTLNNYLSNQTINILNKTTLNVLARNFIPFILLIQTFYFILIFEQSIKVLTIGELKSNFHKRQAHLYLGKTLQIVIPILLIIYWLYLI